MLNDLAVFDGDIQVWPIKLLTDSVEDFLILVEADEYACFFG
jgi:hypothetical protein|tara:strand:+ start:520 stop:645 length:126 start_codon:yes stop_codon:yes gene_type:complete